MANPFIGVRISTEIDKAIAARMQETGQSKSEVVIEALKTYLGMMPCQDRLEAIEQRLARLEEIARESTELLHRHRRNHLLPPIIPPQEQGTLHAPPNPSSEL